ncbi:uncharacterized protein [Euphorbia lathyris]|uniref:uncharacterized protein n=1 Tax=Euphorbia lathyris TaxID=212925 RepID=UPI003313D782
MENKRQSTGSSSFDHLFGPKDSSSSSASSSSSVFSSIFSNPSPGLGRDSAGTQAGNSRYGNPGNNPQSHKGSSKDSSSMYQNETAEPCYFSSSIYYGGQENYSPRTRNNSESHQAFKKDEKNEDPNGNNSNSASRGNWWQGSLYY